MPDPITPVIIEAATDSKVTQSRPVEPVTVAIIGTGDGSKLPSGTIAETPGAHEPNVIVKVVTPIVALMVRFGYDWCVSFSGSMLAGGVTTKVLPHTDLESMLWAAAILATSIAGVGAVKNAATVFSGLEKKFPLASGSV